MKRATRILCTRRHRRYEHHSRRDMALRERISCQRFVPLQSEPREVAPAK